MLELTLPDGNPVTVNLEAVAYFQPSDEGALILLINGASLNVRESYDAIAETLNPEMQAAETC